MNKIEYNIRYDKILPKIYRQKESYVGLFFPEQDKV